MQKLVTITGQFTSFCFDVFTYSTARSATIKSLRVGIAYRIVQILLLTYIIGWELIHNKGYQTFETVSSAVTSKVKGQGFVPVNTMHNRSANQSDPNYYHDLFMLKQGVDYQIMDTADYIIPPNEYNSMFIMTNFIKTEQTPGFCDEEYSKAKCKSDEDCNKGLINTWNGIPTGRCINSTKKANLKSCEGGVVVMEISWICDFDLTSRCLPTYQFRRFDLPFSHTKTASGFNFRFANKFKYNNVDYRVLYKAFGIRIIINVSGIAGKFNIIPLMMTIGTGFGLMSISVLVADCVMLHCTKEKAFFQKMKELDIKETIKLSENPMPNNVARV